MPTSSQTLAGPLAEATYVELVTSLFATRLPTVIMSLLFAMAGVLVAGRTGDMPIRWLVAIGLLASIVRVAILWQGRRRCDREPMDRASAGRIERRFAISYVVFAAILGIFAARTFQLGDPALHMLCAILVVGYAAGVAAGTALRPQIAVISLTAAVLPICAVAAAADDPVYRAAAVALLALLVGGVRSLIQRYRSQAAMIAKRHNFAALARRDHLTGLANRLELAESYDRLPQGSDRSMRLAVHYLDLDDFKPINDRLGHPTGDALLRAVADRLRDNMRGDDVAARLGGDEFVFLQTGVRDAQEIDAMARRLERCLGEPYRVDGQEIVIGASVGSSITDPSSTHLDQALQAADDALRLRKLERKSQHRASVIIPLTEFDRTKRLA